MNGITPAQQKVLDFVRSFVAENQFPPTRVEVASALGFRSPNSAEMHLNALAAKGYVSIRRGMSRGLIVHAQPKAPQPDVGVISVEQLRHALAYDPEVGHFYSGTQGAQKRVDRANGERYLCVTFNHIRYQAHRLAWFYVYGAWPAGFIDHINGDKRDNRIANLRDVTASMNSQNQTKPHVTNKSGFLGVRPNKFSKSNPWQAQIYDPTVEKVVYLGCFPTPEEAHAAYVSRKREIHPGCTL